MAAKGQTGADPVMARNLKFLQATVIPTTPDVIQACLTLAAQQPPNTARALRYLDIVNAYRAWFEASGQQMPLATATSH